MAIVLTTVIGCLRRRRQLLGLVLILSVAPLHLQSAEDPSTQFDATNKLYEKGDYAKAIAAYEAHAATGVHSAALHFNLGNAYFRNSQPGQAIASYRLAQRLAPRDPDIRANLQFARESVSATAPRPRLWDRWLALLSLRELTLLTTLSVWVWFGILTAAQLRRDWARSLRLYRYLSGSVAAFAALWLALVLRERLWTPAAVVVTKQAVLRYGPFEESQSFLTLRDGVELTVTNRKDDWLQVTDTARRIGWLESKDVLVLPPG